MTDRPLTLEDATGGLEHAVLVGDVLTRLRHLPDACVQAVCCSPPYYQLRRYLAADDPLRAHELGSEPTVDRFIANLVAVFREVKRVMRPDAVLAVNLGDSYAGSGKGPSNSLQRPASCLNDRQLSSGAAPTAWVPLSDGVPAKSLLLVPERFAIAMQADGWIVRSRVAWTKASAMPESVTDRPTCAWEHVWLFSRRHRYFWDAEGVRQSSSGTGGPKFGVGTRHGPSYSGSPSWQLPDPGAGANLRNVWNFLGTEPSRYDYCAPCDVFLLGADRAQAQVSVPNGTRWRSIGRVCPSCGGSGENWVAHFAAYPTTLPRTVIQAATSEKGCCSVCSAPWRRVVERIKHDERVKHHVVLAPLASTGNHGTTGFDGNGMRYDADYRLETRTLGWEPTCRHTDAPIVPCVVLDPFLGSGSTAIAAKHLGRRSVGIDLNESYAKLARQRIAHDVPTWARPKRATRERLPARRSGQATLFDVLEVAG